MASLIKYYTNRLEDLNKKYDEYTINYKENFVKYKIPVFNCDLSRGALNTPSCRTGKICRFWTKKNR